MREKGGAEEAYRSSSRICTLSLPLETLFACHEFFGPRVLTADLVYAYDVRRLCKRSAKAGTYNPSQLSALEELRSEDESQLHLYLSHLAFPISPLYRPLA